MYTLAAGDSMLFAGTVGAGVWRRPLSQITPVYPFSAEAPRAFLLSQNFPNPFNPSTTIRFVVPSRSRVKLTVYNVLGQLVEELVDVDFDAGQQAATWNANVPTGTYFYRLEAACSG